ncbi:OLC1v1000383C1 [Oldenlandia corymbosa var. corymbosa]|uniref:OLC1v1000383C1 n=1 Tax=Oldenlandia corymbosa var. corymbosa TaxID=529605 RepID=A0AAV1D2L3_OLDCO|nr:OLC1v1000383C1 [Oldenlandia corymbosa var. corymbosa]
MSTEAKTIRLFGKQMQVKQVRTHSGIELPSVAFLVTKKKLTESDVSPMQGRLLIPGYRKLYEFLSKQEKTSLETSKQGIRVTATDNDRREYQLSLSKWPSLEKLVLNKGWMHVVHRNGLHEFDEIELWCYLQDDEMRFVVDICERHNH